MEQYISKDAIVAEIDRRIKVLQNHPKENHKTICHLDAVKQFLATLEVKDANEALRTEYEKGRADVIQATEQWLANSWPRYCENPNIIKAFKENVIED